MLYYLHMEPNKEQLPEVQTTPVDEQTMYVAEASMVDQPTDLPAIEPVQWQAEEYLQHDKTPLWYVAFALITLALIVGAVLVKAWTFVLLIPVMAAALVVYTHRPPRMLSYVLSEKGLYINEQLHPTGEFKAFGVMQEHDKNALVLIPVKRFRPSLVVYFPNEVGEELVDFLGAFIPMQDIRPDMLDRIIGKLRI